MQNNTAILQPDKFYHIYNRAIGNEKLFINNNNYTYFLKRYAHYIQPVAKTFSYCLLPNHFHFLIQVRSDDELKLCFRQKFNTLSGFQTPDRVNKSNQQLLISNLLSKQFSHLFNSYSQAFNKQNGRKGNLFNRPFKKKEISNNKYLYKIVHYIHYNPVNAGLCNHPSNWDYSSYNAIVFNKHTLIAKDEVIDWFSDLENFIYCHTLFPEYTGID